MKARKVVAAEGEAVKAVAIDASADRLVSATSAVRDVGEEVRNALQETLGDGYVVELPKYTPLESSSRSMARSAWALWVC